MGHSQWGIECRKTPHPTKSVKGILRGIVRKIYGLAPLTQGVRAAQTSCSRWERLAPTVTFHCKIGRGLELPNQASMVPGTNTSWDGANKAASMAGKTIVTIVP